MNILKFTFFYFNIVQELSGRNNWEQSGKLRTIGNLLKQFRPNSTGGMQVESIGEKDFTQWYEKLKPLVIVLILIGRKEITKKVFFFMGWIHLWKANMGSANVCKHVILFPFFGSLNAYACDLSVKWSYMWQESFIHNCQIVMHGEETSFKKKN